MVIINNRYVNKNSFLTVSDAAKHLDVSEDTIRRWEKKSLIKAVRSDNNYRLFSIDELERIQHKVNGTGTHKKYTILKNIKKTKYTSIELFAGCGGTALGFENAGVKHVLLNEFDKNCVATLQKNMPEWNVIHDDVKNVSFTKWENKVDIVQGGFPCQAFSYAGKKRGFDDARGTLFYEFARCVKEVKPKIAMGENVKGLLKHDNGRTLETMVNILEELGYRVTYKVLKAQYHDVPQKRERLIILAIRNDLDMPFIFPDENNYTISIGEALAGCPVSSGQKYPDKKKKVMELIPPGGYWRDLPVELQKEYMGASYYMGGGKTGMARRLSWDEPSLTLTCAPAQKQTERCHPEETRPLTVREYARIQTFPDEWEFAGSQAAQYKQIGNAVPVNLGFHIANALIKMLDQVRETKKVNLKPSKPELIPLFEGYNA